MGMGRRGAVGEAGQGRKARAGKAPERAGDAGEGRGSGAGDWKGKVAYVWWRVS